FFQAEDGIRARTVTGVQTCALPIYLVLGRDAQVAGHVLDRLLSWCVDFERPAVSFCRQIVYGTQPGSGSFQVRRVATFLAAHHRSEERRVGTVRCARTASPDRGESQ